MNNKWILGAPVLRNLAKHIVARAIEANAKFQSEAGMVPKIIRETDGNCCDWCSKMAGTYLYPDVPHDVYRRHLNCTCTLDYYPGDGKRQDVWSRKWSDDPETLERRKAIGLTMPNRPNREYLKMVGLGNHKVDSDNGSDILKTDIISIPKEKITGFLLKPGAKHSDEFFDVGYTEDDHAKLYQDIVNGYDEMNKVDVRKGDGVEDYSIFMDLGVTTKKRFRTVWRKDREGIPRIITAHRED